MLYYGAWDSARASTAPGKIGILMANVPLWRLHLGSVTAPVGNGFALLAVLGLWYCCRRAAPPLAGVMLVSVYTFYLFGALQHGIFGPLGFALRYHFSPIFINPALSNALK
jgi:hypothetical protein